MFSTTESSGAGIVVLLGVEGSEKGLSSPWKHGLPSPFSEPPKPWERQNYIHVQEFELTC